MSLPFTKFASLLASELAKKLASELFYYWPLLRNSSMAIFEDALPVTVVWALPRVTTERRNLGR